MELKWLEDFVSLASTGSFTRSAEERHTTQSTLSRRMKALESWMGVTLFDRTTYPVVLTRAGQQLQRDSVSILRLVYRTRAMMRARELHSDNPIYFGVQHAIARHFFPSWFKEIERRVQVGGVSVKSDNLANCIEDLAADSIDILICYERAGTPSSLDQQRFSSLQIGSEWAIPVSAPNASGAPLYKLPGTPSTPLPHISYTPDAPVGWWSLPQMVTKDMELHLYPAHESSMGEIIREFVLDGRGVAWLPECLVNDDVSSGRLVVAGDESHSQQTEIRAYRSLGSNRTEIDAIWRAISDIGHYAPSKEPASPLEREKPMYANNA